MHNRKGPLQGLGDRPYQKRKVAKKDPSSRGKTIESFANLWWEAHHDSPGSDSFLGFF